METNITIDKRQLRGGTWRIVEGALLICALIGLGAWIFQLVSGLKVTHLTDLVTWGLYITSFMFFVGLSAGGLIVASAGEVFGIKQLKPLAPFAIWLSFCCVGLAAANIIPDLGSPQKLWRLITNAQWSSPFMWDLTIIVCYLILLVVYLFLYSRILTQSDSSNEKNRVFQKAVHTCAYIALPVAIMVHSITAWIFGLQISRSYWYTALLAPSFIASALVSGLALLILSALLARKTKIIEFSNDLIEWLGGLLAVFISVDFFFLLSELLTRLYPGAEGESSPALLLVVGRYAPLFWIEVVAGLVLPFLLLVNKGLRNRTPVIGWASALAILGIFLKRFNLLMAGYAYPYSNLATNVRVGQFLPNEEQSVWTSNVGSLVQSWPYSPTWVEAAIVLGLVAAGILVWLFGIQLISMQVEKNK